MTAASYVARLWLRDFRCFHDVDVSFGPGLTVVAGANGQGKTSLLEAIAWTSRAKSFRGVPDATLVRMGAQSAIIRAEVHAGERQQTLEADIRASGRNRVLLNKQAIGRSRELHGFLMVTVFAPDDLAIVKDGPSERRAYLDDLLGVLAPRYEAARVDFERVLRQRNALLRAGARDGNFIGTLSVFDEQLVASGAELVRGRLRLTDRMLPSIAAAYADLAGTPGVIHGRYEAEWAEGPLAGDTGADVEMLLRGALATYRRRELERGMTLVGPHRDDWHLVLGGLDARTQASQGEQRTLALALRLAGHKVCEEMTGITPVLLLDDVFSELDAGRSEALLSRLPSGQTFLATAGVLPGGIVPERRVEIQGGRIEESA